MSAATVTGANVAANGIRQHYLRYRGTGAPLVLVPGITSPAVTWGFVAERLAREFDVYVLDVRGRGLSQSGPDLDYRLDSLANDLSGFIAALGLSGVTVLGHSMGARIAIRAATRNPAGMARLLLVDPPVSGPGRRPYPSKLAWYVDSIRQAERGMDAEAMRTFCPIWSREQLALRAEWLHTCFKPAIVTAFEGFHTDDIHRDLSGLPVPAGLMVATRGGVIEPADEAEIQSLNPGIRIEHVPDAGHMIPWDNLEGFLAAADRLLGTALAARKAA
ncbi:MULTISPECIES: alpha/beta hydrolase [unclassified Mesorhizobium]|uniref:alpha/beta fold hydrolase n=1 Tax=unclassified Mesorhizobium TaxID=325217 RepID=UPI000FCC59DB|nr:MULTISPECIES: alpha/beta hydrolase [unclassified Mesorhizobium]RUX96387.1 alpha/beta hydrolase [Mesorhizobium sp. M7D.F.Ca.US.004.01.2.1]RVA33774.1 alpha/beta hydrolase [Mesorhizobium sp. M7D.F.Ca.US.004.03.1.1]TPN51651.1 alpha/beta hydrolase [Mesorhizobium sp. B1-1-9]